MPRIINFGSMNVDKVYTVSQFVTPGETISSLEYDEFCGGKGLNQSIALSKAGSEVCHAGIVGIGGDCLIAALSDAGVDVGLIRRAEVPSGHALIQVNASGENCIIIYGGTNRSITEKYADEVFAGFGKGDILVAQNETNLLEYIINSAYEKGMVIVLNPSPIGDNINEELLGKISYLIFNELEGEAISGESEPKKMLDTLHERYPDCKLLLTLGGKGSMYFDGAELIESPIFPAEVVDTTAAGDTFTGYFINCVSKSVPVKEAMRLASKAASLAISVKGAGNSIPYMAEVVKSFA